ncbi:MAG TPA: DUF397 domain-containing protein [Actinoallomurus sp.]|nr:DUF397 domain-containing protein [Actinoallomurus sp.]
MNVEWRKSSHSGVGDSGDCVEVADLSADSVAVLGSHSA